MSTIRETSAMRLKKLVMAGVFCALAYAVMFVMRINVGFLTFDAKDAVITLAGLLFGPVYSLLISFITALLEFITVGDTGFWGFLMDLLSTAIFSTVCALIYKYKKNIKGAVAGLIASVVAMTAFMILFNLFIVPIYTPNFTTAAVAKMVPTLFLPFNLTKGLLNAALVLVLYKPVSMAMKKARVLPASIKAEKDGELSPDERRRKNAIFSLIVTLAGLLIIALCIVVFFVFMNGSFDLVKNG